MFSHYASGKDLNNDFKNYVFLISFLNYIIQYFPHISFSYKRLLRLYYSIFSIKFVF
jgi:hypothetical protein